MPHTSGEPADRRLWRAIAEIVRRWPPGHVEHLAARVDGEPAPPRVGRYGPDLEQELTEAWIRSGLTGTALAAALRAAAHTAADLVGREELDLVWTGPDTNEVPMRRTETVLTEVIREASRELTVVSFVAYEVPAVSLALREALARGVAVRIVLEAPMAMGGRLDVDSVTRMRTAVPGSRVYVWRGGSGTGVIHAKCAVADARVALVTSANLTTAAMTRNMELGVLIRGGRQPGRLAAHLRTLMDRRILTEVQPATGPSPS